ncbi:MAG TPA: hypothetical protein VKD91_12310 [Pyrinomonadaceae bacterium]|nr:hypothetical protein [Pyrinomonadaceae bacterium]
MALSDELVCAFATQEADAEASYYTGKGQFVVRIGESIISAGTEPTVTVTIPEDLDCESFLFERVLTHGLAAALRRAGAFELHCAAVTDPDTTLSALIVGPSGSGKSTLALQLVASGWNFSSDDVVLLTAAGDRVEAHGLRKHFALTSETIMRSGLPGLDSVLQWKPVGVDNKLPLPPQEFFSGRRLQKCSPELLIFAHRTGKLQSHVDAVDQSGAMKRLLRMCPWACLDVPTSEQFLSVLGRLAKQCRAFDLYSGTDLLGDRRYTAGLLSSIVNRQAA